MSTIALLARDSNAPREPSSPTRAVVGSPAPTTHPSSVALQPWPASSNPWGCVETGFVLPAPAMPPRFSTLQRKGERDRSKFTALIIGGGPAGLAAANTIRKVCAGSDVICVEARGAEVREACINTKGYSVEGLAALDVDLSFLSPVTRLEFRDDIANVAFVETPAMPHAAGPRAVMPTADMLKSWLVAQALLWQVERALYEAARAKGVQVVPHGHVTLATESNTKRQHAVLHVPGAASVDLGYPDLVVVADGSHSDTATALGVTRQLHGDARRIISGCFDLDLGGLSKFWFKHADNGEVVRSFLFGHAQEKKTFVQAFVPSNVTGPEAERTYYLEAVSQLAGVPISDLKPRWITPLFSHQCSMASQAVFGTNVIFAGDAFMSCGGLLGAGLNNVLGPGIDSISAVTLGLAAGSGHGKRRRALEAYTQAAEAMRDAYLQTLEALEPAAADPSKKIDS